ncbi:DNA-directed RNA polymerase III subunit RPC8 [Tanacetum coccineum]
MLNLTKLEHTLSLSLKEAVIANLGLCISVYDIESIYGGFIFANESAPTYTCLKLLYALAVTRLDENTDIIWEMLDKALGKADGNQDILATTTWEKEFVEEERSKLSFNGFQYGVIIHEYLKTKDRRSLQ